MTVGKMIKEIYTWEDVREVFIKVAKAGILPKDWRSQVFNAFGVLRFDYASPMELEQLVAWIRPLEARIAKANVAEEAVIDSVKAHKEIYQQFKLELNI